MCLKFHVDTFKIKRVVLVQNIKVEKINFNSYFRKIKFIVFLLGIVEQEKN